MLVSLLLAAALAAEVVWLGDVPEPEVAAAVGRIAAASGPPLVAADLRAADTSVGARDTQAVDALRAALLDARAHEMRLDGEAEILRLLDGPIAAVEVIPDAAALAVFHEALVYQGFAAWRLYGDALGTDPDASPWRLTGWTGAVPRPWAEAVAVAPTRRPGARELAEATARSAFDTLAPAFLAQPVATLVIGELPAGAVVVLDGVELAPGTRWVQVVPGRHLAHVALDGRVVERVDVRLAPAEQHTLDVPLQDEVWSRWLASLQAGKRAATPAAVRPKVEALGGDVVVAWTARNRLHLVRVDAEGAAPHDVPR